MSLNNLIRIFDSERKAITSSISFKELSVEILELVLPELEHGAGIPHYDHSELFVKVEFFSDNISDLSVIVETYYNNEDMPDTTEIFCDSKNITKKILYKIITASNSCIPPLAKFYQDCHTSLREGA
jgi:hypothetical protein